MTTVLKILAQVKPLPPNTVIPFKVFLFIATCIVKNEYDFTDQEDLLTYNELDQLRGILSRLAHTNPSVLLKLQGNPSSTKATPLARWWKTAVHLLGHHYSSDSASLNQS